MGAGVAMQGAMPNKMKLVVVFLILAVGMNVVSLALGHGGFFAMLLDLCLLGGLLQGNEGVRRFMRSLAVLDMLVLGTGLVMALLLSPVASPPALVALAAGRMVMVSYVYWALGKEDVRDWMFQSAFNLDGVDLDNVRL